MTMNLAFGVSVALTDTLPSSVNFMAFKNTQETSLARSRSSTTLLLALIPKLIHLLTTYRISSRAPGDPQTTR